MTGLSLPPRAHYCRTCQRIVMRMDHHCAFLNTCIGHANHVYFLRFLLFLAASTLYVFCGAAYALGAVHWNAPATGNDPPLTFTVGPPVNGSGASTAAYAALVFPAMPLYYVLVRARACPRVPVRARVPVLAMPLYYVLVRARACPCAHAGDAAVLCAGACLCVPVLARVPSCLCPRT